MSLQILIENIWNNGTNTVMVEEKKHPENKQGIGRTLGTLSHRTSP
jgi:hypothetical protein